MLLPKCTYNLHSRVPQILVQKSHFAYLTSMGGRQKCITISVRHMRHNAVWNSRICLNIVWLLMLTVLTSFSSLKKMWEAGINYYFGTCAVFPLFMWSEGMMLEEQHSLLWDLLIFKTWFETWKNTQSFLLKKKKSHQKNPPKKPQKSKFFILWIFPDDASPFHKHFNTSQDFFSFCLSDKTGTQLQPSTPCASAFVN